MDFDERAGYLLLGCVLGAIFGYFARMLQEIRKDVDVVAHDVVDIKEEVDTIETIVKNGRLPQRDEVGAIDLSRWRTPHVSRLWRNADGKIYRPRWAAIALFLVVVMAVYASFSTGIQNAKLEVAISDIKRGQDADKAQNARLEKISQCTLSFTSQTITALNQRTTYTPALNQANVEVLQAQADFLDVVFTLPPVSDEEGREAGGVYRAALDRFNAIAAKNNIKVGNFAYPTNQELADCLGVTLPEVETGEPKAP